MDHRPDTPEGMIQTETTLKQPPMLTSVGVYCSERATLYHDLFGS